MNIIHKSTAIQISKDLSLNATGEEQDWYLEAADKDRILEFLEYYQNKPLIVRRAMMALIIASFDVYLENPDSDFLILWNRLNKQICDDFEELEDVLLEWSEIDEGDNFKVSYFINALVYAKKANQK
ncbi:hypothetical protein LAG90_09250 [Marinilongibacter aquaticus]|uniref:hypothetical protein n=1 Tax=Marinilongibacter aquaticus TaxID=2975157 RepID=UPI0021BCFC76|nr:hypothetical protein [Marinilongibacter aquaticus]UBM60821.1 hypothetical protein LAG90_09250 [Marinilongibacter aquaticus]